MTEDQAIERIEHALRASDMAYSDEIVTAYARIAWNAMKDIAREDKGVYGKPWYECERAPQGPPVTKAFLAALRYADYIDGRAISPQRD